MIVPIHLVYKSGRAQVAWVWLVLLVPLQVPLQCCHPLKGLATLGAVTQVHSLFVQLLVPVQRYLPAEFGRAQLAGKPHLSGVVAPMVKEAGALGKLPTTDGAGIWLLTRMQHLVIFQAMPPLKTPPTHATLMTPAARLLQWSS